MWFTVSKIMILHIAIAAVDHDGVSNHLLMSEGEASSYAISLSTDNPIPYKYNEWFKAKVNMRCSEVSEYVEEHKVKAYICNADSITIKNTKYELSKRRQ